MTEIEAAGSMMRALLIRNFQDPPAIKVGSIAVPAVGERDVLIRIEAAGINPVDLMFATGRMQQLVPRALPLVLGWDCAGRVAEVGPGVTRFQVGQKVIARPAPDRGGTFADYAAVDEAEVALWPDQLDAAHAAILPLAGLTAYNLLFAQGGLKDGERVLILGGSGGVGHLAVQMARNAGAHVIATGSAASLDEITGFGAREVYDYADPLWAREVAQVDLIADCAGPQALGPAWPLVKPGGRVRSIVAPPALSRALGGHEEADQAFVYAPPSGQLLEEIVRSAAAGALRPVLRGTVALPEGEAAITSLAQRHRGAGKTVMLT